MSTVLTLGEALTDIVIRPGRDAVEIPGGSPMNVAVALGRLGHESHLLTQLGRDARGDQIARHVSDSGVRFTKGSVSDAFPTSHAKATIGEFGAATYEFSIRWEPSLTGLPNDVEAVHFGSIGAVIDPGAGTMREAVAALKERAIVSFDPNARPSLMGAPADARKVIESCVEHADIVKASDEDIAWLYGTSELESIARSWLERGARIVCVTRGGEGAVGFSHAARAGCPRREVPVVDTVGAGDTFSAGIIDALSRMGLLGVEHRERIGCLSSEELTQILEHAAHLSSITVSREGANPPWLHEISEKTTL